MGLGRQLPQRPRRTRSATADGACGSVQLTVHIVSIKLNRSHLVPRPHGADPALTLGRTERDESGGRFVQRVTVEETACRRGARCPAARSAPASPHLLQSETGDRVSAWRRRH